jgi:molybdopterin converting factor small subunit
MIVGVRYLAQLRRLAGCTAEQIELPDPCTAAGLVAALVDRHPALQPALVDEHGQVRRTILVFVGDEQAGPDRLLGDGDEVTLLTPIAGGG